MALHVADYLILRDDEGRPADFEMPAQDGGRLRRLGSETKRFTLPLHAVMDETAVLAYVLDPVPFGGEIDFEYEIEVNEHLVRRERIRRSTTRGVWGLVRADWMLPSPDVNVVVFRETQHSESRGRTLHFSNIVLWFQRSVAEP